jgi:hypothetical protein
MDGSNPPSVFPVVPMQKLEICPLCKRAITVPGSKCREHGEAPKRVFMKLARDDDAE